MTEMLCVNIILLCTAVLSLHLAWLFSRPGIKVGTRLQRRFVVFYTAVGWCCGYWAASYPDPLLGVLLSGFISFIPLAVSLLWLHLFLCTQSWVFTPRM